MRRPRTAATSRRSGAPWRGRGAACRPPCLSRVPWGPRSPRPRRAEPRSRRAARGPQAAAAEEAETIKAGGSAGRARLEDRPLGRAAQRSGRARSPGSAPPPARPGPSAAGERRGRRCRGGARGAGAGARGGARGAIGAHWALLPSARIWGPSGSGRPVHCPREGRRRGRARAASRGPRGRPHAQRPGRRHHLWGRGGRGRGGRASPPDVTLRHPRAYQGPPGPQPNSASLASRPHRLARLSRTLAARLGQLPGARVPSARRPHRGPSPPSSPAPLHPSPALLSASPTPPVTPGVLAGDGGGTARGKVAKSLSPTRFLLCRGARTLSCWRSPACVWSPPRDSLDAQETKGRGPLAWAPGRRQVVPWTRDEVGQQQVRLLGNEERGERPAGSGSSSGSFSLGCCPPSPASASTPGLQASPTETSRLGQATAPMPD